MSDCDIPNKCPFCGEHTWCENSAAFQRRQRKPEAAQEDAGQELPREEIAGISIGLADLAAGRVKSLQQIKAEMGAAGAQVRAALTEHRFEQYDLRCGCSCGWGTTLLESAKHWDAWVEHVAALAASEKPPQYPARVPMSPGGTASQSGPEQGAIPPGPSEKPPL